MDNQEIFARQLESSENEWKAFTWREAHRTRYNHNILLRPLFCNLRVTFE